MDIPTPTPAQPTRFLDKVRSFIRFHGLQLPEVMGSAETEVFLDEVF
ncbi:hypothetical protein SAMN04487881_2812 [Marinobacter sp. es.048]|nr:hypothetical protein SAMN04487881_2812 [Marinobacter sp. es.048]